MTPIYVGIGVGVSAALAYAIYKYYKKKRREEDSVINVVPDDSSIEEVHALDYQMLLSWLRTQYKEGIAKPGDSFVILQNANALPCLKEAYPKVAARHKDCKCLLVSVMEEENAKVAKFFIYEELASSLMDLLPKDEGTAYIQKLS